MIYSRWRPDRGGYDYFETSERRGLGNDMPVPLLVQHSPIGVASTDIGRQARGRMRHVGSGPMARGAILPLSRSGLSGSVLGEISTTNVGLLAIGLLVGFIAGAARK